jgi:hypothetical protein
MGVAPHPDTKDVDNHNRARAINTRLLKEQRSPQPQRAGLAWELPALEEVHHHVEADTQEWRSSTC